MGINHLVYFPATAEQTKSNVPSDAESMRDDFSNRLIRGLTVEGEEKLGLATWTDEAVVSTTINKGKQSGVSMIPMEYYQDIKDYFERPRMFSSFDLPTNRNSNVRTLVTDPAAFWPASAYARLNGCFGYRCDIKFTMTVAATPFQQGVAVASWQYATQEADGVSVARYRFPPLVTNLPHVRLDVSESTMAELYVPYNSPWDWFQYANGTDRGGDQVTFPYGMFVVQSLLPYVSLAGVTAPNIKLYVSLHNLTLYGAVPVVGATVIPQSGDDVVVNEPPPRPPSPPRNPIVFDLGVETQAGDVNLDDEAGVARPKQKQDRRLSKTLRFAGHAAPFVGAGVAIAAENPAIIPQAVAAGYMLTSAADVAEEYGYSKPVDERPIDRVFRSDYAHDDHIDQLANDFVVSPFQSNRLVYDQTVSDTPVDEMALSYVLGRYCQAFQGSFSTSDGPGTYLYATNICPTSFWFKTNTGRPGGNTALPASSTLTTNAICPTALCYISQMFRYWRGSIKFRFTFAKTKFHAGRLLVSYVPATFDVANSNAVISNPVPAIESITGLIQPAQHTAIFDLKDSNTFEFEVPYVSARPWLSTYGTSGGITMVVLDRLITTGAAASAMDYLVEVAAGPDYSLAAFVGSGLSPANGGQPQNIVVQQSGDEEFCFSDHIETQSGGELRRGSDTLLDVCDHTMGEKFSSLKQLIMVPTKARTRVTQGTNVAYSLPLWYYAPLWVFATPMPTTSSALYSQSTQNCIARMYSYVSGGSSYHVYADVPTAQLYLTFDGVDQANIVAPFCDPRRRTSNCKPIITTTSQTSTIHAKVPSYQKTTKVPAYTGFTNTGNLTLLGTQTTAGGLFTSTVPTLGVSALDSNLPINLTVSYAAADDAHCSCYIGPPPVMTFQSTQSVPVDQEWIFFAP